MRKPMILAGAALVLGLAFAGCDNNGNGGDRPVNNPPAPAPGAAELTLAGRVYTMDWGIGPSPTFTPLPSGQTRTVSGLGGTGAVSNGQLGFSIGTPASTRPVEELWFPGGGNITFNPSGARAAELPLYIRVPGGTHDSGRLDLLHVSGSLRGNSFSSEWAERLHIFVDRDVTVRQIQDYAGEWQYDDNGFTHSETFIVSAFTLNLRQGWNVVHVRDVATGTFAGPVANPTSVTMTTTITVSVADPGRQLRWTLSEWDDFSAPLELSRGALPSGLVPSPFRSRR